MTPAGAAVGAAGQACAATPLALAQRAAAAALGRVREDPGALDPGAHRHRCEVRYALGVRAGGGYEALLAFLTLVAKRRGKAAARALLADTRAQWRAGNRGLPGDWREALAPIEEPEKEAA